MNLIYSIIVSFLLMFAISALLENFSIVNDDLNASITLLSTIAILLYSISRKFFEQVSIKEFSLALFIIFTVLIITLLISVIINKDTGKDAITYLMPFSIFLGLYSLLKNNYTKLKEKRKKCPCCKTKISINYFSKQILLATNGSISFTKNEKGITCQKCNKSILSAEKKNNLVLGPMFISMIPIVLLGLGGESYIVTFILVFSFSFIYFMILVSSKYYRTDFICEDKSSDEYNYYSIHG